jgi:hypothetical protein
MLCQAIRHGLAAAVLAAQVLALDRLRKSARLRSWLIVAAAMVATYLPLAGFIRRTSKIIARQQQELSDQVVRLKKILTQKARG